MAMVKCDKCQRKEAWMPHEDLIVCAKCGHELRCHRLFRVYCRCGALVEVQQDADDPHKFYMHHAACGVTAVLRRTAGDLIESEANA